MKERRTRDSVVAEKPRDAVHNATKNITSNGDFIMLLCVDTRMMDLLVKKLEKKGLQ